jgi:hypothetical protein
LLPSSHSAHHPHVQHRLAPLPPSLPQRRSRSPPPPPRDWPNPSQQRLQVPTAPELFQQMLRTVAQDNPTTLVAQDLATGHRQLSFNPLHHAALAAQRVIAQMWASSTWAARNAIFTRFKEFCQQHHLDPLQDMDFAIILWCEMQRATTLPSSRLKYSVDLTSMALRLNIQVPIARMYQAGLRASGALMPTHQAPALSLEQLRELQAAALTQRTSERLLALMFIMWKSASRFDEASALTGKQLLLVQGKEVIIWWSDRTKTTRTDPFRADLFVIIRHEPMIPPLIARTLRLLQPAEVLFPHTGGYFNQFLAQALPDAEPKVTAHSFKAGALAIVGQAVAEGRLESKFLPMLAKHQTNDPTVEPRTTVRYTRDHIQVARRTGLDAATILLPW